MFRFVFLLLAAGAAWAQGPWDLLLTGGTVIDPRNGVEGPREVAIAGGRIAAVAERLPRASARRVITVEGMLIVPGLLDAGGDASNGVTAAVSAPAAPAGRPVAALAAGALYAPLYGPETELLDAAWRVAAHWTAARRRGVLFGTGSEVGQLRFDRVAPAVHQGMAPDVLAAAPGRSLLDTVSIFLHFGMPLREAIAAASATPARLAGRAELGHLAPGAAADLAVLRLEKGTTAFLDGAGHKIAAAGRLTCQLTLRGGAPVWDPGGRVAEEWEKARAERFEYRPGLAIYRIGPRGGAARPAILWIHGGGWTGGRPEMFLPAAAWSAEEGAIGFTVQYRLGKVGPAVEDVEAALLWLRAHAAELGIDPHRIIAAGDSAGGHLALALGTVSVERADAILAFNPIPDLTGSWRERAGTAVEARRLSPLFQIDARTPPVLLLHGTADTVVPAAESARFRDAHSRARLVLYRGSGHAFIVPGYTATPAETGQAMRDSFAWLREIGMLPEK